MTSITNKLVDAAGQPVQGVRVYAHVVPAGAFSTDGTQELVRATETITNDLGVWALTLTPQSGLQPEGTYYQVIEGTTPHSIVVPDSGTHDLADVLVDPVPQSTGILTGLTQAVADARYADQSHAGTHAAGGTDLLTPAAIGASATGHGHALADTAGLQGALDGKVDDADLAAYQPLSAKGQANGYAGLGSDGLVPAAQLPAAGVAFSMPPDGYGYKVWTHDPLLNSNSFARAAQSLAMVAVYLPVAMSISNLHCIVTGAGTAPDTAFSGMGVYDDTGTLLRASADQPTDLTSLGWKTFALTSAVVVPAGRAWLALLHTLAGNPSVAAGPLTTTNETLNSPTRRRSVIVAGQSTLPASVDIAAASLNNGMYWMGAS